MGSIMITRQPIYDRKESAAGYDIRFRPTTDGSDPLAESLLNGALELIASGLPVWVTVSEAQVVNRVLATPGNASIVAMIPAALEPTAEVLDGLQALEAAGVVVAIDEFHWLALAAFASRADQTGVSGELTEQAVRRAFIAEGMARQSTGRDPQTAFLVGLFSLIDAVFRIPMGDVVERINLASEVRQALLDRTGPYAGLLHFIEAYELGQWDAAVSMAMDLGVDPDVAGSSCLNAVAESRALLRETQ